MTDLERLEQILYRDLSKKDDYYYTCDRSLFRQLYLWNEKGVTSSEIDSTILKLYDFLENESLSFSSLDGYLGIYWFFKSLEGNGYYQDDLKFLPQLFESIKDNFNQTKTLHDYDPLYGNLASMHAFCLLDSSDEVNSLIVQLRDDFKGKDIETCFSEFIDAGYSLSFAHGWPGIMVLLSHLLHKASSDNRKWLEMFIVRMTDYIIHQVYNENKLDNERLAWCFGHFGIALMLTQLDRNLGLEYESELNKSIRSISAYNKENAGLNKFQGFTDISLCHGLAGIFYLTNYFAHLTKSQQLFSSAKYWLNQILLEYSINGDLKTVVYDKNSFQIYNAKTFMEGKLGLALILQSLRKKSIVPWQKLLMIP